MVVASDFWVKDQTVLLPQQKAVAVAEVLAVVMAAQAHLTTVWRVELMAEVLVVVVQVEQHLEVTAVAALFVSSGPAPHAHSRQQTQGICDEPLYSDP